MARSAGADVDLADFREFELPIYDGDLDAKAGLPPGGLALRRHLEGADAVLIAAPEYNCSGGIRGLWQTRIPLEGCGALVFPDMFALPHANEAFDDSDALRDASPAERLRCDVVGFVRLAEAVAPVCGKTATAAARKRQEEIARALEAESELQPPSQ
jgi:hypothetical protein